MAWTRGDLNDAHRAYRVWLESRDLSPVTVESHHRYAGMFLRWLYGDYSPRGRDARRDPLPSTYALTPADLDHEFHRYGPYLLASGLKPTGVPTYVEGARLFVKFVTGRRPRAAERDAAYRSNALTPPTPAPALGPVDYRKRIRVVAGKRGGQPTIRGLRITVADVLSYLAAGMTEDRILADFPDLRRDDIRAALAYAADRERGQAIALG